MTADVAVAGAGPTGLMLACELRLAGARPVVLERLPAPSGLPKANGLVGQIVQLLDYRGLLARFSAGAPFAGPTPSFQFGGLPLKLSRLGASPLHVLPIPQARLEQLLGERARELGAEIRRGHELIALSQDDGGVTLDVRGPAGDYRLRTRYLVGCDGAHSLVRKQAGIDFPGTTSREVSRMGRVTLPAAMIVPGTGELEVPGLGRLRPGWNRNARGTFSFMSFQPGVHVVSTREEERSPLDLDAPMTLEELRASVRRVLGADLPMSQPQWLSRIVGQSRQADRYRAGRVLLVGDAAHLFSAGGSALNVGLLDAVNLGWKLAAAAQGWAPPGLLDTYHTERHAVGRRVLMHTRAQSALMAPGEDVTALLELFGELLEDERALRHVAELLHGADTRYDMSTGATAPHPLAGRWAPDLALTVAGGAIRVAELMHDARPVLLDLAGRAALSAVAAGWRDRVAIVTAHCDAPPAAALLIRPDCHVAWATTANEPDDAAGQGLRDALTTWFGAPAPPIAANSPTVDPIPAPRADDRL